jgi:hypothetical protein
MWDRFSSTPVEDCCFSKKLLSTPTGTIIAREQKCRIIRTVTPIDIVACILKVTKQVKAIHSLVLLAKHFELGRRLLGDPRSQNETCSRLLSHVSLAFERIQIAQDRFDD